MALNRTLVQNNKEYIQDICTFLLNLHVHVCTSYVTYDLYLFIKKYNFSFYLFIWTSYASGMELKEFLCLKLDLCVKNNLQIL